jgi:hypothetical protein
MIHMQFVLSGVGGLQQGAEPQYVCRKLHEKYSMKEKKMLKILKNSFINPYSWVEHVPMSSQASLRTWGLGRAQGNSDRFLSGFIVGGVIGGLLGWIFAPQVSVGVTDHFTLQVASTLRCLHSDNVLD